MNFIIDLILILIIVLSCVSGIRKGFIHSVMNIITFIASLICGWQFYPILGAYYKEHIFLSRISQEIQGTISSLINNAIDSLFHEIPDILLEVTDRFGIDINNLESYYNSQSTATASELTSNVSKFIANPVATTISDILAFLTIFLAVTIILKIITLILDLIFKLPVLKTINRFCGAILGIFTGLMYAALFAMLLAMLSPVLNAVIPQLYSPSMIESSVFVNVINKLNIVPK